MSARALVFVLALAGAGPLRAAGAGVPADRPKDPERSPLGRSYEKLPDRARLASGFKFAVLDPLMDKADDEKKALVDRVVFETRRAANTQVPGLGVMTKETMVEILQATPQGCADGECAAKTGERVGADYIVDGKLRRGGSQLEVELRLWKVAGGLQLSTILAAGATGDALVADLKANLAELLKPVQLMLDQELASAKEQVETRRAQAAWEVDQRTDTQRQKQLAEAQAKEDARQKRLEDERLRQEALAKAREEARQAEQAAAPRRSVLRKVGWVALGLGVAGGIGSTVGALTGKSITDKIKSGGYATVADLVSASNRVGTTNQLTRIGAITAGSLLVAGLGLVLFNQDPDGSTAALTLAPDGVLLSGRF